MNLKDIWAKLKALPKDKLLHLGAGVLVGGGIYLLTNMFIAAVSAAALAGISKELWDRQQNKNLLAKDLPPAHDVDPIDAAATIVGGVIGAAVAWAAMKVFS